MAFNSSIFLVWFLPVFLLLYFVMRKWMKNSFLLLISIFVYAWAEPKFVIVLLATTCFDFYLVKWMYKAQTLKLKKIFLLISILINVGLLIYFKYSDFFIENLNALFGAEIPLLSVILPLGISFYTFETITYVVDVYRGVHEPQKKIENYLLYIFYFPKMIAGPIVRYHEIAEQLKERDETNDLQLNGFYRFCFGLAKKVLIANQLAMYGVDRIFYSNPETLNGVEAWIGIVGYTMQIYMDFSAYSDMAIGLGKMTGFKLPENFDSPYLSSSITEFWRRWHITLGNWMRNYLYIPLGGNRVGKGRMYFNLWLVFLISGLWHKGSWSFIIWGAFHGMFLVLDRIFLLKILNKVPKLFSILFTFLIVNIAFVLFRINDLPKAINYYKAMLFSNNEVTSDILPEFWLPLILAFIFSFINFFSFGKKMQSYFYDNRTELNRHVLLTFVCLILFVLALSYNTRVGYAPFIYFRF